MLNLHLDFVILTTLRDFHSFGQLNQTKNDKLDEQDEFNDSFFSIAIIRHTFESSYCLYYNYIIQDKFDFDTAKMKFNITNQQHQYH